MHTNLEDKEEYETVLASVRQVVTLQRAIQSMREGDKARFSSTSTLGLPSPSLYPEVCAPCSEQLSLLICFSAVTDLLN